MLNFAPKIPRIYTKKQSKIERNNGVCYIFSYTNYQHFFTLQKAKKSYPYAVNQDEKHAFKNGQKLHLKHNSLSLPSDVQEHTLFLKIKVKSSLLGFLKQPYIEISAEGKSLKQYIEHGAKGDRYLNISNFNSVKEITLKPKRMQICSDEVELFQFKNPELKDKKF